MATLGSLAVGSTVSLKVNGTPKEFLVVHQGRPADTYGRYYGGYGTWLWAKSVTTSQLIDQLDDVVKSAVIPVSTGESGMGSGTPQLVFILSMNELGLTNSNHSDVPNNGGGKLDYFIAGTGTDAKNKRKTGTKYWTRSWDYETGDWQGAISEDGSPSFWSPGGSHIEYRHALILNQNAEVDGGVVTGFASGTLLGDMVEGSIVKVSENGTLVDFYVAKHNYESGLNGAGRTLIVRRDVHSNRVWYSGSTAKNPWIESQILAWLNGEYFNLLDDATKAVISDTAYYFTYGGGNTTVSSREDAVFLLSLTEFGRSLSGINVEGANLPTSNLLRVAWLNGSRVEQWTRSPNKTYNVATITNDGGISDAWAAYSSKGARPAFTMPAECVLTENGTLAPPQGVSGSFGVSGVARELDGMMFGVAGVAREVEKLYLGVNGVAREC